MTATVLALLFAGVLLLAALGGPALLRRAAPAFSAAPLTAMIMVTATVLLWIAALVAIGPIVAWASAGPAWLPEQAAQVCSRCLSAASPFGESAVSFGLPAVIPLALPILGGLAVIAGLVREFVLLRRSWTAVGSAVHATSTGATVQGYSVRILPDAHPHAFSLPSRHAGIVVTEGALAHLAADELAAVLEHERAHLAERHHLLLGVLHGATHFFSWIPAVRAARDAVASYAEIAADHAAKKKTGSTALASALLTLGDPVLPTAFAPDEHLRSPKASTVALPSDFARAALNVAGSERIRHLVGAPRPPASLALAGAIGAYALMLTVALAAVHWPYLLALLTGC